MMHRSDKERSYALAHLSWLARERDTEPPPSHSRYNVSDDRAKRIRADVERQVRGAADRLTQEVADA